MQVIAASPRAEVKWYRYQKRFLALTVTGAVRRSYQRIQQSMTSYFFSTVTLGLGGTVVRLEANSQKSANCNPQEEQRNEIYPISRS